MKRKALIRHLEAHGCTFLREGGQHSLYRHVATHKVSTVPRYTDINAELARKICKDLGIPAPAER